MVDLRWGQRVRFFVMAFCDGLSGCDSFDRMLGPGASLGLRFARIKYLVMCVVGSR